jgi:hypothetical protein
VLAQGEGAGLAERRGEVDAARAGAEHEERRLRALAAEASARQTQADHAARGLADLERRYAEVQTQLEVGA